MTDITGGLRAVHTILTDMAENSYWSMKENQQMAQRALAAMPDPEEVNKLAAWCRDVLDEANEQNIIELFQTASGKGNLYQKGIAILAKLEEKR